MNRHLFPPLIRNLVVVAAITLPSLLFVAAGCRQPTASSSPLQTAHAAGPDSAQADSAQYVGNEACAECHKTEFDMHHGSRHAATLRRADAAGLGSLSPPTGRIAGTPYVITGQAGNLHIMRSDLPGASGAIQYALGSGKTVMTYIGDIGPHRLTEFGISYRPHAKAWCVTPGQERLTGVKLGVVNELGRPAKCILCHAVKVKPDSAEPAPGFLGVGCESCHGPGGAHVAAMKTPGATDIKMERVSTWGAARINAMCARCHRGTDDLSLGALETNSTARFQPFGLEMSPCFKKSGDKLSCVTCHNPHTDVGTDPRAYEKVCLSCHTANVSSHNTVCPVNPKDKCIGCHMPKEPVFVGAHIPVSMADHLIWAYRPQR